MSTPNELMQKVRREYCLPSYRNKGKDITEEKKRSKRLQEIFSQMDVSYDQHMARRSNG